MSWKNLRIGTKLTIGFGLMLLLIFIGGLVGYSGLKTVDNALTIVADEEAPIVEMANEMKISLWQARNTLEEFKGATSVIASSEAEALDGLTATYQQTLDDFDKYTGAILKGADLGDGEVVLPTDNNQLRQLVEQADEIHDAKFQAAARQMMESGRQMIAQRKTTDAQMKGMENAFDVLIAKLDMLEGIAKEQVKENNANAWSTSQFIDIISRDVPVIDAAMELMALVRDGRIIIEEAYQANDQQTLDGLKVEFDALSAEFSATVAALFNGGTIDGTEVPAVGDARLKEALQSAAAQFPAFKKDSLALIDSQSQLIAGVAKMNLAMAALDAAGDEANQLLGRVEELSGMEMLAAKTAGRESSEQAVVVQLAVVMISLLVGLFLGAIITRQITKPVRAAVDMLEELENGHLDKRIAQVSNDEIGAMVQTMNRFADSLQNEVVANLLKLAAGDLRIDIVPRNEKDEVRRALKTLAQDINEIMGQIQLSGEQIAVGATQVADASQSLSQGATESASSLEQVTSSMSQMASQVRHSAESASTANQLSSDAQRAAAEGNQHMEEMVSSMAEINAAGQNISKIIKVIDEIAFQTNLLALNAAVEAARAGQHGKGFAVVAEEVRNLAARSAKAAEETADLIEGSVNLTDRGAQIAGQTAEALSGIMGGVTKVSDLLEEIAAAANEQAEGIAQVSQGLEQIDRVTQQNTANAEESAAAAEELSDQAEQMKLMLGEFILKQGNHYSAAPQLTALPHAETTVDSGWAS